MPAGFRSFAGKERIDRSYRIVFKIDRIISSVVTIQHDPAGLLLVAVGAGLAYMDVGEGREQDAEALPTIESGGIRGQGPLPHGFADGSHSVELNSY